MNDAARVKKLGADAEPLIRQTSRRIWELAEEGMRETASADYYVKLLSEQGVQVETGVCGLKTGFVAQTGSGKPVIAYLGEFDALPGLSQEAGKTEHRELRAGAWGHGCGHNCLGAAALGAFLIHKEYMKQTGASGTLRFYGCPGEENGSGKTYMARAGLFDDVDACITWHPSGRNGVESIGSLAVIVVDFEFFGRTAHAASAPQLGRSALDACELTHIGANYLREHIVQEARLHYAYQNAGGKAPNVVHDNAKTCFFVRAPKSAQAKEIFGRLCDIARGAALMTETRLEIKVKNALSDYIPNDTLGSLAYQAFCDIGAPEYDENDALFAKEVAASFAVPANGEICREIQPYTPRRGDAPASTDVGDASYCAPTVQLRGAIGPLGLTAHSWQMTSCAASPMADKTNLAVAEAMALTGVRAAADGELLAEAKRELARTAGKYVCPMPSELTPDVWY